tara:strand:- start:357 stop:707 length:351 start_codon:yes stop_codon:yes gene_type:complete
MWPIEIRLEKFRSTESTGRTGPTPIMTGYTINIHCIIIDNIVKINREIVKPAVTNQDIETILSDDIVIRELEGFYFSTLQSYLKELFRIFQDYDLVLINPTSDYTMCFSINHKRIN